MAINKLNRAMFLAELQNILAIAAGNIKSAVIKNIPTILTDKAIVRVSKIKNEKFQNSQLIPEIFAKLELILINKIFLKAKIKNIQESTLIMARM